MIRHYSNILLGKRPNDRAWPILLIIRANLFLLFNPGRAKQLETRFPLPMPTLRNRRNSIRIRKQISYRIGDRRTAVNKEKRILDPRVCSCWKWKWGTRKIDCLLFDSGFVGEESESKMLREMNPLKNKVFFFAVDLTFEDANLIFASLLPLRLLRPGCCLPPDIELVRRTL